MWNVSAFDSTQMGKFSRISIGEAVTDTFHTGAVYYKEGFTNFLFSIGSVKSGFY
jgi:hypothetical protein